MPPASLALRALALGSGAGGGVPQWNCGCRVCRLAWSGDKRVKPRTQAGLALSVDGANWVLLNASIDLRQQILATPALHPRGEGRHSPIAAVVLTNAEVDSAAGLLALREGQPFVLFGARATLDAIGQNRMFDVVDRAVVPRLPVRLGRTLRALARTEARIVRHSRQGPALARGGRGSQPARSARARCASRRRRPARGLSMRRPAPMLRPISTLASPARTCCFSTAPCSPTTK